MVNGVKILTKKGVEKLEKELEHLKSVRRQEVAERIKQALAFGDLSENSEYDEAKNEQAFIEGRIATIQKTLKNAEIVDDASISTDKVGIGATVRILDLEFDEEIEYTIVGSAESDPSKNYISNESPVGAQLIGRTVDEVVDISVPDGIIQFKILEIHR